MKYLAISFAMLVSSMGFSYAATPAQVERAEKAVVVAMCKRDWIVSGNTDKLAVYAFMAMCLSDRLPKASAGK